MADARLARPSTVATAASVLLGVVLLGATGCTSDAPETQDGTGTPSPTYSVAPYGLGWVEPIPDPSTSSVGPKPTDPTWAAGSSSETAVPTPGPSTTSPRPGDLLATLGLDAVDVVFVPATGATRITWTAVPGARTYDVLFVPFDGASWTTRSTTRTSMDVEVDVRALVVRAYP